MKLSLVTVADTPVGHMLTIVHNDQSATIARDSIHAIECVGNRAENATDLGTTIVKHVGGPTVFKDVPADFHGGIETAWILGLSWPWDEDDPVVKEIRAQAVAQRDRVLAAVRKEREARKGKEN